MEEKKEAPGRIVELDEFESAAIASTVLLSRAMQAKAEHLAAQLKKRYGLPPETDIFPLDPDWTRVRMVVPAKKDAPPPPDGQGQKKE